MKEFIISALPFVVIGVCVAIIIANATKSKTNKEETYITEGLCLGVSLGVVFSTTFNLNLGLGMSLGMLIGETLGVFIKKK